jgi:DNA-directed RNA polymerase beta' subunit
MSMMSHRIKLMDYSSKLSIPTSTHQLINSFPSKSFSVGGRYGRLSTLTDSTSPYNADFDGDEMNLQYVSPSPPTLFLADQ